MGLQFDWSWLLPDRCVCCTRKLRFESSGRSIKSACLRCQPSLTPTRHTLAGFESCWSLYAYQGEAAYLLKIAKYSANARLLNDFGNALAGFLPIPSSLDAIVVTPSHPILHRKRGLNPARLIATPLARRLDVPVIEPFKRSNTGAPQAQLSWHQRVKGPKRTIKCVTRLPEHILIIDDVITSGSTMRTLGNLALQSGATKLHAAVICEAMHEVVKSQSMIIEKIEKVA